MISSVAFLFIDAVQRSSHPGLSVAKEHLLECIEASRKMKYFWICMGVIKTRLRKKIHFAISILILRDIYIFHLLVAIPHVPQRKTATFLVSARAEIPRELILLSSVLRDALRYRSCSFSTCGGGHTKRLVKCKIV